MLPIFSQFLGTFYCTTCIEIHVSFATLLFSMTLGDASSHIIHIFLRKSLTLHPETEFTILHKDKKFTIFLAQHLTTSDNPTSLQFWWIYNSNIWLKVENLKYCRKEEKIQNQATRVRDSKMPTFSHFYSILIGKNSNKISLIKKSD